MKKRGINRFVEFMGEALYPLIIIVNVAWIVATLYIIFE
jgi:hypothetical protein